MLNKKNFPGLDGFVWWTGIVEDRKDPLKCGRVLVRCFVWHTENKSMIPTDNLFWAQPIFATNASNDTYVAKEGDAIFGFFIDGDAAQMPFFFGRFPDIPEVLYPPTKGFSDPGTRLGERPSKVGSRTMKDGEGVTYSDASSTRYPNPLNKPTTSRLARNEDLDETPIMFVKQNIIKNIKTAGGRSWDETQPEYAAEYPYNNSKESESGHYFDIDDTKKKERITLLHRVGTMHEIRASSSTHRKDLKNSINLVHGSEVKNVRGNLWTTIERWTRYRSKGRTLVEINADAKLNVAGTLNLNVTKDLIIQVGGRVYMSANGEIIDAPGEGCSDGDIIRVYDDVSETTHGEGITFFCPDGVGAHPKFYSQRIIATKIETVILNADLVGSLVVDTPLLRVSAIAWPSGFNFVAPTVFCLGKLYREDIEYTNKEEVDIKEVNARCEKTKDKNKNSFDEKMKQWLDRITAPTGGGFGATWCYKLANGTEGCISTHHATSDGEILEYFVCLGAVSATGHENNSDYTQKFDLSGRSCKIDQYISD